MSSQSNNDGSIDYDATIRGREILTPAASKAPVFQGALVFGARPEKWISYRAAASGERPLAYEAVGLPPELTIDRHTGWITGRSPRSAGDYAITLRAKNRHGETSQTLILKVGEAICLTPPMGWNSWYVHSEGVSEKAIREMATAMEEKGLDQFGWTYINIDDCWMGERDPKTKAIRANAKFQDMKSLREFVNSKGFKLGIYSTPWMSTYAGYIGGSAPNAEGDYREYYLPEKDIINPSQYFGRHPSSTKRGIAKIGPHWFVDKDAEQFAAWGIDYVKYDWVEAALEANETGEYVRAKNAGANKTEKIAKRLFDDFRKLDRDIVISLSPNTPPAEDTLTSRYCNLWRLTPDIESVWEHLTRPFGEDLVARYPRTRPGLYGDLDMLQIGPLGKPNRAEKIFVPSPLTPSEQYFQVTLWCMLTQPLLLSCNIPTMDTFDLNLVTNGEVLAINQDPLVHQGYRIENRPGEYEIWGKDLHDGDKALAFFNLSESEQTLKLPTEKLGITGKVRDLWRQKDIGELKGSLTVKLNAHGAAFFKIKKI